MAQPIPEKLAWGPEAEVVVNRYDALHLVLIVDNAIGIA